MYNLIPVVLLCVAGRPADFATAKTAHKSGACHCHAAIHVLHVRAILQ